MGCDGGTIPTRDELVKKKKKEEKVSKEDDLKVKWLNCALSQAPLEKPIVACQLGRLFSKESVIEFLLAKASHPSYTTFNYIKNLKDVKDLHLANNPAYKDEVNKVGVAQGAPYICPIAGIEMNGNYRFLYLWTCGCVVSERAMKEIKGHICPSCNVAFSSDDMIMLNGNEEEVVELKERMEVRKANKKKRKKTDSEIPNKKSCHSESNGFENHSSTSKETASQDKPSESTLKMKALKMKANKDEFMKLPKAKLITTN